MCCFPQAVSTLTFCASFTAATRKCNNLRDRGHSYELPDLWLPNSPDLNPVDWKNWSSESTTQKCKMWMIWGMIDVWVGVEQSVIDDSIDQWRRRLHACIRAKGGHFEYSLWQKLVKMLLTEIIKLKFVVKRLFQESLVSWYSHFTRECSDAFEVGSSMTFYYMFTSESESERILKIGQELP